MSIPRPVKSEIFLLFRRQPQAEPFSPLPRGRGEPQHRRTTVLQCLRHEVLSVSPESPLHLIATANVLPFEEGIFMSCIMVFRSEVKWERYGGQWQTFWVIRKYLEWWRHTIIFIIALQASLGLVQNPVTQKTQEHYMRHISEHDLSSSVKALHKMCTTKKRKQEQSTVYITLAC